MQNLADILRAGVPIPTRRALARTRLRLRMPTGASRLLPDFLIIGTMRGGTSSLYKYLANHPCIVPSLRKEIEFFSDDYARGLQWYRAHFPLRWRAAVSAGLRGRPLLAFEASPYYLFHPHAAARAARLLPHARIIVLLRNPVDRAFSHHQHLTRLGLETLHFEEAIAKEPDRIGAETERLTQDPDYTSKAHRRFSYLARGLYADQLEGWFRHFPREQFLVVRSEDFYADVADTYGQVLHFLGLQVWKPATFANHSYPGRKPSPQPGLIEPTRRRLEELFARPNARLYDLLGRDLGWEQQYAVERPGL